MDWPLLLVFIYWLNLDNILTLLKFLFETSLKKIISLSVHLADIFTNKKKKRLLQMTLTEIFHLLIVFKSLRSLC